MTTTLKEREKSQERGLARRRLPESFPDVFEEMERLWSWPLRPLRSMLGYPTRWVPTVDMYEKDDHLILEAELPGLKKEEVEIRLEEGALLIEGTRKLEKELKEENYYRAERAIGSFQRRIFLPFEVKVDEIEATFKDGILTVRMPKPPEAKTKTQTIPIR